MGKVRLIRNEGGSRVITVTDILPKEWQLVEVIVQRVAKTTITVKLEKVR